MLPAPLGPLFSCVLVGACAVAAMAQSPRNVSVTFNGDTDPPAPLAVDAWHAITASYRYPGGVDRLTNTYLVIVRGGDPRTGFYLGYHVPSGELGIVKHGQWNATEATGLPGETGRIIENDQGYMDCEHTVVTQTADDITVAYRVKFKPGVLQGVYSVLMYIEDRDVNYEGFTAMGTVTIDNEGWVHRSDMPARWRNSLTPAGEPVGPLTLAEGGRARYVLALPSAAGRVELKAAGDLARHLQLICGADFATVDESDMPAGTAFISIGRTNLLADAACKFKDADLAEEGYALEVVDGNIYLYGGSGRGLLHGVYSLLEEDLGCRWYSNTSVDTPRAETLSVRLVPRMYVPALQLRDPYIHSMHEPAWSLRNKTNSPHARIPMAWGGSIRFHAMGHTYASYFPTERYFAEHPEYYALVNGKRQPTQLCHTNEDVIRQSIEKTCEIFRNHPEVTITAIGPNDGRGFCDCPECRKLDEENGGRSGSFFHHVNRIAEGVKKEFPNNHLICLAYLDYARPPTNMKVDDYIIIQLCTDSHAWKCQFCNVWESQDFQGMIKAWDAVDARVFIWDYTTDYVHYLVPMANWPVVNGNTRFFLEHGATGAMYESELNDIDEMRAWVWAKQLWDPYRDTRPLMEDFVFGYYKEAAEPIWDWQMMMWNYWERWHKEPHTCGQPSSNPLLDNLHCSYAPDGPMFTEQFMANMRDCFSRAESLAQTDEILARVKKAKLSLLYLELAQQLGYYTEFGDFVYGKSIRKPPQEKAAFSPMLDEFTALCTKYGLHSLGIPITLDKITARWQSCIDAESAALPKAYLPADWVFATDPEDSGVSESWYAEERFYAAAQELNAPRETGVSPALPEGLSRLHINRGVGWEQQGFPGFEGYGWYFQSLEVPPELAEKEHLYLYFSGVNEQAWVYVNGEPAFERTYGSTGASVGDLIGRPFSFDAKKWLRAGKGNRIAVRVTHSSGLGGICFPAMMVGTDEECSTENLAQYRY